MAVVVLEEALDCDIKRIWDVVTSLDTYTWRSDLKNIEQVDEKHFIEYTKEGYATHFYITGKKQFESYSFEMENENMKGHWVGFFHRQGNQTILHFSEEVTAKKWIMKPFVKMYLKKQQKTYLKDLEQELGVNV